ncbi:MAG: helix-turn-helix transcriptional regulator [Flavobacteriales bacterium]|nr:helix-turn-helix transcriptional regulator [Flavobacteriales bacterium]
MLLYIKNMVCSRCKMAVEAELINQGFHPKRVDLGEVEILEEIDLVQRQTLEMALLRCGFSLIDNRKGRIIEKVKNLLTQLVQEQHIELKQNLSDYLSERMTLDYTYLSNLYTHEEGRTIEHYFISQKIEKVKELLMYDELTLSQIADKLNYSSVAYLSTQFKRVTGMTPSSFKKTKADKRTPIDSL